MYTVQSHLGLLLRMLLQQEEKKKLAFLLLLDCDPILKDLL